MDGNMKRRICIIVILTILICPTLCAQIQSRSSIVTSAIDPFFSIYFIKYSYDLNEYDSIISGGYYLYSEKSFSGKVYPGSYQGTSLLLGYRRYLFNKWYVEEQIMPLYARYFDSLNNKATYGFELWNEIHIGYKFKLLKTKVQIVIDPQLLFGLCIYENNEPLSFSSVEGYTGHFFKNLYVLPNVLIGVSF
jgi:hypothetical protein